MVLSNRQEVNRWLDSIEDQEVREKVWEMITQGKIQAVFIPDAIEDAAWFTSHPRELEAIRIFGNMHFNND